MKLFNFKKRWHKYLFLSFIEALFATFVFWVIFLTENIEITRSMAGDIAFSTLNKICFANKESKDRYNSEIDVYYIDYEYLKFANMIDDYNETNYGYIFPRSEFAQIIDKIDSLPKDKQPLSLFIDYSFEEGSASYDSNVSFHISDDDKIFLKSLAKNRKYTILLPQISNSNFIEKYAKYENNKISKSIAKQIKDKKIVFVNPFFLKSDNKIYRYNPLKKFSSDNIYYNIALVNWQLIKNGKIIKKEIENLYNFDLFLNERLVTNKGKAIFKSNILYKDIEYSKSKWNKLYFYSAKELFNNNLAFNSKTMVMIGVNYKDRDLYINGIDNLERGVAIHAESTKTVLFLDGKLKSLDLRISFAIIFIVFFVITLIARNLIASIPNKIKLFIELFVIFIALVLLNIIMWYIFDSNQLLWTSLSAIISIIIIYAYYKINEIFLFNFIFEIILLVSILFFISCYILLKYKLWFNWIIPVLIFYIEDIIMLFRSHVQNNTKGEN